MIATGRLAATTPETASRSTVALRVIALITFTIVVLVARRPDQFTHPYAWIEDGTIILPAYLDRGFDSIFEPVSGYLILSSKLIALSAFKLSAEYAPEIMVVLTTVFTCSVILAIALSPTHLPLPYLCAIATLIIPTDPEVFAISELSFWWAGLLSVLALLWDAERGRLWLRAGYLVFGGLSSPIVVPVAGLLVLRALVERRRSEFVAAAVAVAVAAIQIRTYGGTGYPADLWNLLDPNLPLWSTNKFVAYFFASLLRNLADQGSGVVSLRVARACLGCNLCDHADPHSDRDHRSDQCRGPILLLPLCALQLDAYLDCGSVTDTCSRSRRGRIHDGHRVGLQGNDEEP
jgi:hypothetical protein